MGYGDYRIALDALTFHEAFAHLVSYEAREIGDVDWNAPELRNVGTIMKNMSVCPACYTLLRFGKRQELPH